MPRVQRGKVSATFEAREAAGCGSLRLLRALGGTRILQAAAPTTPPCFGRWPRSSPLQTRGCTPLVTPKQLGSIQKIQVASLKDFLCYADLKSLARRDIRAAAWFYCWRGCSRRELATADAVDLYDLSCEKANQKSPQAFLICKYKNIISADIVRAKRRQFKIVTSSKAPLKREREYHPL